MTIFHNLTSQRGVTLIEALIAMAVMAFGMLALVGVQSTLRLNADLARERAEATRLAERQLEIARGFTTVGETPATATDFDSIGSSTSTLAPDASAGRTTSYTATTVVKPLADGLQKTIKVTVAWVDRYGSDRSVILRDIVSRSSPVLSGLVSSVRTLTAVGQRRNRHPTIPAAAVDLGHAQNESMFRPPSGGSVAWVFNNITGTISRVCVVDGSGNLTGCVNANAQLLSGYVRFNLRGVGLGIDGTKSAYKPISNGVAAYIIQGSNAIKICPVAANILASSIDFASLLPTCTDLNPSPTITPFNAADPASYTLNSTDSDDPRWPSLNLNVALKHDNDLDPKSNHTGDPICYSNAPKTALEAASQNVVEYFCLIYPKVDGTAAWAGQSTLVPLVFSGDSDPWSIGTDASSYKVCRYTTSSNKYADNANHPETYAKWMDGCGVPGAPSCRMVTGNLINQNFLIINGSKACPTDIAANPPSDLVNSNTLQHQP